VCETIGLGSPARRLDRLGDPEVDDLAEIGVGAPDQIDLLFGAYEE
jgi:hypothetical protein